MIKIDPSKKSTNILTESNCFTVTYTRYVKHKIYKKYYKEKGTETARLDEEHFPGKYYYRVSKIENKYIALT